MIHLFHDFVQTKHLWQLLKTQFSTGPDLTPQSAFFGFHENRYYSIYHIHLIFKIALYKYRQKKTCNLNTIINKIGIVKSIKDYITF